MRLFPRLPLRLVVPATLASLLHAQTPAPVWRHHESDQQRFQIGATDGFISLTPSKAGGAGQMAKLSAWSSKSALTSHQMPFEYCGAVCELGGGHFLACGTDTLPDSTTYLVRFQLDATWAPITILETVAIPGFDFVAIAYDGATETLTCLDDKTRCLTAAALPAPASASTTPILPTHFSRVVSPNLIPALLSPLASLRASDGKFLVTATHLGTPTEVTPQSPMWTVAAGTDAGANEWRVGSEASHAVGLRLRSDAARLASDNSYTVETVAGQTIASGEIGAVGTWHRVPAPSHFYEFPGYPCMVKGPLSAPSAHFYPFVRYGQSNHGQDVELGRAMMVAPTVAVGADAALCLVSATVPSIAAGEATSSPPCLNGYLLLALGYRGPGATPDPITGTGTDARLLFTEALAVSGQQVYRTAHMGSGVALPSVPELADFVLLTQWAMVDPADSTSLVYSDICAVRIQPGAQGATARSTSVGALSTAQKEAVATQFRAALQADPRCQTVTNGGKMSFLFRHRRQ